MIFGKRFLFAALAVAAALGCLFGFAACGDDGEEQQPPEVYLVRELTFDNVRLIPKYYGDNFQGYSIDLYHEGQPLPRMDSQWEMLKSDGTRGSSAWFSDEGMPLYLNYMSGIFECVAFEKEADGHTRDDVYWKGTAVLFYKDVGITLDLRAADYLPAGDYTVRLTGDVGEYDVAIEDAVSLSRFVSFDQKFRLSPRGTEHYWYSFTYYAGTSGNGSDNNTVHLYLDGSASGAAGLYNGTRAAFTVKMYNLEDDWLKEAGSTKVTHSDPFSLFSKGTNLRYRAGYFTNGRTPLVSGRIYYVCFAFDRYASGETQFWLTNTMIR